MHKVGSPYHFSAVAASSGSTLRTLNAAVTKNSTDMGRGFWLPTAWCEHASAHVTTTLRSPVTRAASERGKVGRQLSLKLALACYQYSLACGITRRSLLRSSRPVAAWAADWCRANINRCRTVPAGVLGTNRRIGAQAVPIGAARDQRVRPALTLRRVLFPPREILQSLCRLHSAL
jgi:hypothetical protein